VTTQPKPILMLPVNGTMRVFSQLSYAPATTSYIFNRAPPASPVFYRDYLYDPRNVSGGACFSKFGVPPVGFACGTSTGSGNQRMSVLGCMELSATSASQCANTTTYPTGEWKALPTNQQECLALMNNPASGGTASEYMCARPLDSVNAFVPPLSFRSSSVSSQLVLLELLLPDHLHRSDPD
jgi:hypothetical protein